MAETTPTPALIAAEGRRRTAGSAEKKTMLVQPRPGGGHVVTHLSHDRGVYKFGKDEGPQMLAHVAEHGGADAVPAEGSDHENADEMEQGKAAGEARSAVAKRKLAGAA